MNNVKLSVVSPVYKAEKIVDELVHQLQNILPGITEDYEIILVEDGSPDGSWERIAVLSKQDRRVKGISLSRNFGQHHAITAGVSYSKGDYVVVMDCDLQDVPAEIIRLHAKIEEGYDIVFARRQKRQDTWTKRTTSRLFYIFFSYLSGIKYDERIANFGIYRRQVIDSIKLMNEPMRAFPPMVKWVGFKSTVVDVVHGTRYEGSTSYNWSKLLNLALDISISYSDKPLKIAVKLGIVISILSFFVAAVNLLFYFTGKITQPGFTSLIVSLWFLSGMVIFFLGIVGLYAGKILEGVKARPHFLVREKTFE